MINFLIDVIVKRQRIYKKIKFSRRKYSGYTICDKLCYGWSNCEKDIRVACNQYTIQILQITVMFTLILDIGYDSEKESTS